MSKCLIIFGFHGDLPSALFLINHLAKWKKVIIFALKKEAGDYEVPYWHTEF